MSASQTSVSPEQLRQIEGSLRSAYATHGVELEDAYCSFVHEVRALGNHDLQQRMLRSGDIGKNLKRTMGEDPVGFLADMATVLTDRAANWLNRLPTRNALMTGYQTRGANY